MNPCNRKNEIIQAEFYDQKRMQTLKNINKSRLRMTPSIKTDTKIIPNTLCTRKKEGERVREAQAYYPIPGVLQESHPCQKSHLRPPLQNASDCMQCGAPKSS